MTEEFPDLGQGQVDLAILQGAPQDQNLIMRWIADVPWAVFASRKCIEHHGRPRGLETLGRHWIIEFDGPMRNHAAALWMRSVAVKTAFTTSLSECSKSRMARTCSDSLSDSW
jgi:DNA-binding transcriptional LysR family regulator